MIRARYVIQKNGLRRVAPLCSRKLRTFSTADSIFNGNNTEYIEEMHSWWLQDPSSVHSSWQAFFKTGKFSTPDEQVHLDVSLPDAAQVTECMKLHSMALAYQRYGHSKAKLDPLGLSKQGATRHYRSTGTLYPGLEPSHFGWSENDLQTKSVFVGHDLGAIDLPPLMAKLNKNGYIKLQEIYEQLNEVYGGTIGYEIGHIREYERSQWLLNVIETEQEPFPKKELHDLLVRLTHSDHLEKFLALKFPSKKRYGLDGVETMVPCIKSIVDECASHGVDEIVIGMPHRGRLNTLVNIVKKNPAMIFSSFAGIFNISEESGAGDIAVHFEASHDRITVNGNKIHLSLLNNPSHLEAVNALTLGKCRAKMFYKGDPSGDRTASLVIHGDAAFSGQGIVYECMSFSDLPDYQTGGCIHLIVNNQIGFTTDTVKARSTAYCSDMAKSISAPIFHVNADDPEAVVRVAKIAAQYRQAFHQDVVIDLICYRKLGHNEGDEPRFTQPVMYRQIDRQLGVYDSFKQKLIQQGVVSEQQAKEISDRVFDIYNKAFEESKTFQPDDSEHMRGLWEGIVLRDMPHAISSTSCNLEDFSAVEKAVLHIPDWINIHPRIQKIWSEKASMFTGKRGFDWATAEQLAFGTLMREGTHVRLSGQDVERGTFSHRHAVLHEQVNCDVTNRPQYRPLTNIDGAKGEFMVSNSNLSEFGVLGFDLGFSLESPHCLVLWEAQFGDFANGAQIIFDQFLSSGESKWKRQTGIVVLLPHGYEGAGSEHSSCRMERWLQMCDDDPDEIPELDSNSVIQQSNWGFLNCSTPANYFHALRRQIKRNFRKPLIIATPKSLLKLRQCVSEKKDFLEGSEFQRVIPSVDPACGVDNVKRHIFCSGKVYYDLEADFLKRGVKDIAISRLEQIAPFPFEDVIKEIKRFPNAELMWVQEEPKNMGAFMYVRQRFHTVQSQSLGKVPSLRYVGRKASASPATGLPLQHKIEVQSILDGAATML